MSSVESSLYSLLPWGSHVGLWGHGCGSCVFVVFFGVLHLEAELLREQSWRFMLVSRNSPLKLKRISRANNVQLQVLSAFKQHKHTQTMASYHG